AALWRSFNRRHASAQTVRSPWARAGQDVDSSARVRGRACKTSLRCSSNGWKDAKNGGGRAVRYRVNSPQVISETVGGETIIVNLASGHYFSLQGTAVDVWQGLERGDAT